MKLLVIAVLLVVATTAAGVATHLPTDLTRAKRITFKICDGWRVYQVGQDLVVVCPGQAKPFNGIELRPYYTLPGA